MRHYSDDLIKQILTETSTIAVVGFSRTPERASHIVAWFLHHQGYRVIPVNPGHGGEDALGETIAPSLSAIPPGSDVDMVDIFRRSDQVLPVVEEALARFPRLKVIWMQLGVENAEAAALAEARGVTVIMNRCPKIEYERLIRH